MKMLRWFCVLIMTVFAASAQQIVLVANLNTFGIYPVTNRQVGYTWQGLYGPGQPQYATSNTNGFATFNLTSNNIGIGVITVPFTPIQAGVLLTTNDIGVGPVDVNSHSIALPAVATQPAGQQAYSTVASDLRYVSTNALSQYATNGDGFYWYKQATNASDVAGAAAAALLTASNSFDALRAAQNAISGGSNAVFGNLNAAGASDLNFVIVSNGISAPLPGVLGQLPNWSVGGNGSSVFQSVIATNISTATNAGSLFNGNGIGLSNILSSSIVGLGTLTNGLASTGYVATAIAPLLTTNGNGGALTNLLAGSVVGSLNPVISSNPSVVINDPVVMTNQALSCYGVGGIIAAAAQASNAVVLVLGDSYTQGTGGESTPEGTTSTPRLWGKGLRQRFGDDGQAGCGGGWGYGWDNYPCLTVVPPTNIWPGTYIACLSTNIIKGSGYTNYYNTIISQQSGFGNMPRNRVTLGGLCYFTWPGGGLVNCTYQSASTGYSNNFTINTASNAVSFVRTNFVVPSGSDYSCYCTNVSGSNFLMTTLYLSTNNPGVQYWDFGFSGTYNDTILEIGTNLWSQVIAAVNPNVLMWYDIHYGTSVNGNDTVTWSNDIVSLLSLGQQYSGTNLTLNAAQVIATQPQNISGGMAILNYGYRAICDHKQWSLCDQYAEFPSYTMSYNMGLFETVGLVGIHPSFAGMFARDAVINHLMGLDALAAYNPPVDIGSTLQGVNITNVYANNVTIGSTNYGTALTINSVPGGNSLYVNGPVVLFGGAQLNTSSGIGFYGGSGLTMNYNNEPIQGNNSSLQGFGNLSLKTNSAFSNLQSIPSGQCAFWVSNNWSLYYYANGTNYKCTFGPQ